MCRPKSGAGHRFDALAQRSASVAQAFFAHLVHALTVGQVGRVDQAGDSSSALGFAKIESERAGVGQNVSADGLGWVAPHGIGLRVNLVGDQDECVVDVRQFLQVLQMAVELLLSAGKHTTSDELSTEMTGQ